MSLHNGEEVVGGESRRLRPCSVATKLKRHSYAATVSRLAMAGSLSLSSWEGEN
jgi:hypothetical protein